MYLHDMTKQTPGLLLVLSVCTAPPFLVESERETHTERAGVRAWREREKEREDELGR